MTALHSLSETDLIAAYQRSGEAVYAGELFKRYTHLVFGVCMKYLRHEEEAKDAVLDLFEKLLGQLSKPQHIQHFPAWLHQVTVNHCLMRLRSQQRRQRHLRIESQALPEASAATEDPYGEDQREMTFQRIESHLALLPETQRLCIELFYWHEMSYQQIADKTGLDLPAVKSHIQNGRRTLRQKLALCIVWWAIQHAWMAGS